MSTSNGNSQPSDSPKPNGPFWSGGAAERNALAELLYLMGSDARGADALPAVPILMRIVREGNTLFAEGAQAEAIYFIRAGTFKTFRTAEDGYEQVLGFAGRTELVGFESISTGHYASAAVALEDSSVYALLLRDLLSVGKRNAGLDRTVLQAVSRAMVRRGELAGVMSAVAAEVKLARFFMHLSDFMRVAGQSALAFHLRMSRRDIASYLGVAHETISRAIAALVNLQLVSVRARDVQIRDMRGLQALCGGTRQPVHVPIARPA